MNVAALNALSPSSPDHARAARAAAAPRSQPLTGAALRNAPEAVQRAEVSAQFEAILLRQMLAPTMTSMLGSESGAAASVYGDMLTDTLAQQLSRGGGLGLAQMMAQQLAPRTPVAPAGSPSTPSKL
jgi:flagellar protein FlgJ